MRAEDYSRDPQGTRIDAEIISALRRAWLLPRDGTPADPMVEAKFSLDAAVSDEGTSCHLLVDVPVLLMILQDPTTAQARSSCLPCVGR